jgi:hypothetical protein
MSIMGVNHILIINANVAVTAAFNEQYLPFFNDFLPTMNNRGVYYESNLYPFFTLTHDLANTSQSPRNHAFKPSRVGAKYLFLPLSGGLK